jgi:hypothetical protein
MTIETLKIRVRGSDIIAAVQAIAKNPVQEKDYINGQFIFKIGQRSDYLYKHLRVTAEGQDIDPEKTYKQVEVLSHNWGGDIYPCGCSQVFETEAVSKFAESLKEALIPHAISDTSELVVLFTFEGKRYEISSSVGVNVGSVIVLPDGRAIVVHSLNETCPPSPRECAVIGQYLLAKASE